MKLQRWLFKTFSVSSSIGGFGKTLNKLGLSFKICPTAEQTCLMLGKHVPLGSRVSPPSISTTNIHSHYQLKTHL